MCQKHAYIYLAVAGSLPRALKNEKTSGTYLHNHLDQYCLIKTNYQHVNGICFVIHSKLGVLYEVLNIYNNYIKHLNKRIH